jgi:very-short-patch-repair endonuclease
VGAVANPTSQRSLPNFAVEQRDEYFPSPAERGRVRVGAMRGGASLTKRSQFLRRNMTEAERVLWRELRHDRLGCRFRRQHPIPPYIVDFACLEAKLVVEAHGGQHADSGDRQRDAYLRREGWKILRFWNNDVLQNRTGVLQTIAAVLAGADPPTP